MIFISTMEHLPDTCDECPCLVDIQDHGIACVLYEGSHSGGKCEQLEHCPLKEVVFFSQEDKYNYGELL